MEQIKNESSRLLEVYNSKQKVTIAEMLNADCLLLEAWKAFIEKVVVENNWQFDRIEKIVLERIKDVSTDLMSPLPMFDEFELDIFGEEDVDETSR